MRIFGGDPHFQASKHLKQRLKGEKWDEVHKGAYLLSVGAMLFFVSSQTETT